jgi:hypothetical protein
MTNTTRRNLRQDESGKAAAILLGILAVVLIIAIPIGFWAFNVATSEIKGQGDAVIEKNSAENWTAAQAGFEQDYQDILSSDLKIMNAFEALQATPDDKTAQTNYTGLKSYCLSAVAKYNADARSYLSEDFRAADLPAEIDTRNSTTDCKE